MIAWVNATTDDSVVLLLFKNTRKGLIPHATMTEVGDEWSIQIGNKPPVIIAGSGCPDPIEFLMTLSSPRNTAEQDEIPLMSFNNGKEKWEVWEVL